MENFMRKLLGLGALVCVLIGPAVHASPITFGTPGTNEQYVTRTNLLPVGGSIAGPVVAQTVTASSAYTSGNAVGGLMTVPAAFLGSGSGLIQSVVVNTKSAQTTAMDVVLFSANPTGSTCTDKTAFSVVAADFSKVIGVAHVTDWTSLGTPSTGQSQTLAIPITVGAGVTTFYACLVTRSTPTYTATTDVAVTFGIPQN
jgi:hypothetical protein